MHRQWNVQSIWKVIETRWNTLWLDNNRQASWRRNGSMGFGSVLCTCHRMKRFAPRNKFSSLDRLLALCEGWWSLWCDRFIFSKVLSNSQKNKLLRNWKVLIKVVCIYRYWERQSIGDDLKEDGLSFYCTAWKWRGNDWDVRLRGV